MNTLEYKTVSANKATVNKAWVLVDAKDQIVGRIASRIAILLRGKHKPYYTPHVDCGDHVIVINADKALFTGEKEKNKRYIRYTGYPGGQREMTPEIVRKKYPIRIIEKAVKGMLPKNKLGRQLFKNLMTYAGEQHPHTAQNPKKIN